MATVKVGGRPATEVSGGPKIEDIKATNGALHVNSVSLLEGEDTTYHRLWGGNKADSKSALTGTAAVKASAGYYYGYTVTTALSAAAITLYDNASAASGTVIDVIPASTAAGTTKDLATPIPCTNGIYASFAGTGTVLFLYT